MVIQYNFIKILDEINWLSVLLFIMMAMMSAIITGFSG